MKLRMQWVLRWHCLSSSSFLSWKKMSRSWIKQRILMVCFSRFCFWSRMEKMLLIFQSRALYCSSALAELQSRETASLLLLRKVAYQNMSRQFLRYSSHFFSYFQLFYFLKLQLLSFLLMWSDIQEVLSKVSTEALKDSFVFLSSSILPSSLCTFFSFFSSSSSILLSCSFLALNSSISLFALSLLFSRSLNFLSSSSQSGYYPFSTVIFPLIQSSSGKIPERQDSYEYSYKISFESSEVRMSTRKVLRRNRFQDFIKYTIRLFWLMKKCSDNLF